MGYFDELIEHLNRKKPKNGDGGYFGKPIIHESDKLLIVEYNYYYVTVLYDSDNTMQRPLYCPYKLSIEKPCVIKRDGGQELGTAFSEAWWSSPEDVWLDLQNKWRKLSDRKEASNMGLSKRMKEAISLLEKEEFYLCEFPNWSLW